MWPVRKHQESKKNLIEIMIFILFPLQVSFPTTHSTTVKIISRITRSGTALSQVNMSSSTVDPALSTQCIIIIIITGHWFHHFAFIEQLKVETRRERRTKVCREPKSWCRVRASVTQCSVSFSSFFISRPEKKKKKKQKRVSVLLLSQSELTASSHLFWRAVTLISKNPGLCGTWC